MIIVTGTKRSGTSMWMQLLVKAGFPPIGEAFPRDWESTIKEANLGGFWESELRRGIYYETNPDPKTGVYLFPHETRRHAVKVFVPGLIRTDRAFIDRVVATVRPWRQYIRSVDRLYTMEREARRGAADEAGEAKVAAVAMSPGLEWWVENFSLISDIVTRRYPFFMVAYDSVLESPKETLRAVFDWLGEGDAEAAAREVAPARRTQDPGAEASEVASREEESFEPEVVEVFDALYDLVRDRRELDQPFVDQLNETNERLSERISVEVKRVAEAQRERQRLIRERMRSSD